MGRCSRYKTRKRIDACARGFIAPARCLDAFRSADGKIPTLVGRTLSGVTFSIDRGRVVLDRPGWLEHSTQNVQHPVDRVSGEIPAVRGEQGLWIGGIPVLKPTWATVEFRSVQKHPSRAVPAVEIVPTVDRPPSIAMELPGGSRVVSAYRC